MTEKSTSADAALEHQLQALQLAGGDQHYRAEHDRAAEWLLKNPDTAYPRLLALARSGQSGNPAAVLALLARFGRADSLPLLEQALTGGADWLAWNAGSALAIHPMDEARTALERGLGAPRPATVIAAADGLLARGGQASCGALKRALGAASGEAQLHVLQAALRLDCLSGAERAELRNHPEPRVRELVERHGAPP